MQGNLDPVQAAEADLKARAVQGALEDLEQAGRGIHRVHTQLASGVPRGNEVHYLIIIQGMINQAAFVLSNLNIPPAPVEESTKKLVI